MVIIICEIKLFYYLTCVLILIISELLRGKKSFRCETLHKQFSEFINCAGE